MSSEVNLDVGTSNNPSSRNVYTAGMPVRSDAVIKGWTYEIIEDKAKEYGIEVSTRLALQLKSIFNRAAGFTSGGINAEERSLLNRNIDYFTNVEEAIEARIREATGKNKAEFSFASEQELFQTESLRSILKGIVNGSYKLNLSTDAEGSYTDSSTLQINGREISTRFLRNLEVITDFFALIEVGALAKKVEELNEEVKQVKAESQAAIADAASKHDDAVRLLEDGHASKLEEAEKANQETLAAKNAEHEARVKELEAENARLQAENAAIEQNAKSNQALLGAAREELKQIRASDSTNQEELAKKFEEVIELQDAQADLNSQLAASQKSVADLEAQIAENDVAHKEAINAANVAHTEAVEELKAQHQEALIQERAKASEKQQELIAQNEKKISKLRSELEQAQTAAIAAKDAEILQITDRADATDHARVEAEARASKLEEELEARGNEQAKTVEEKAKVEGDLEAARAEVKSTREALEAANSENERLSKEASVASRQLESYSRLGISSAEDIQLRISASTAAENSAEETSKQLTEAQGRIASLSAEIGKLQEENEALKEEVKSLKGRVKNLEAQLASEREASEKRIAELEEALVNCQTGITADALKAALQKKIAQHEKHLINLEKDSRGNAKLISQVEAKQNLASEVLKGLNSGVYSTKEAQEAIAEENILSDADIQAEMSTSSKKAIAGSGSHAAIAGSEAPSGMIGDGRSKGRRFGSVN